MVNLIICLVELVISKKRFLYTLWGHVPSVWGTKRVKERGSGEDICTPSET